jgi:hypothetical protein
MNSLWRMVTIGHNARVFVSNRRLTERDERVTKWSEGEMPPNTLHWSRAWSNPQLEFLWRLWQSATTLTEPFRPDGDIFCLCFTLWLFFVEHYITPPTSDARSTTTSLLQSIPLLSQPAKPDCQRGESENSTATSLLPAKPDCERGGEWACQSSETKHIGGWKVNMSELCERACQSF